MGIEIRLPSITGQTEREQLLQMRSYLYQLAEQLQWALNTGGSTTPSSGQTLVQTARTPISSLSSSEAAVTFATLKPLIIKSADIVEAYYEEINKKLEGLYLAQSDFGTFVEKTEQDIEVTSKYVDQKFSDVQMIISDEIDGVRVSYTEDMDELNKNFSSALGATDSRITEEVQALTNAIDQKIGAVNEEIGGVNGSIEKVNDDIGTVNERIDNTNESIVQTNTRIDEANAKITQTEEAIAETNTRIDNVNKAIAETNEEIQGVNDLITTANGKIDGLTEAIEDTNANIDILIEAKDLNAEDVEKLNGAISKINGEIGEINTSVETIEGDITNINDHVTEVDGQIVGINTAVESVERLTGELGESVGNVENSIKETNTKVGEASEAVESLKTSVEATDEKVNDLTDAIEDVNSDIDELKVAIIEANAYIRSGLLYYDENEIPVYGLEVGQRNLVNGVEVFNKYARFTANRLSFYDANDNEVAYISDYKLFIRNAEITSSLKMGGFVDTVMANGDVVTKWVGGDG